LVERPPRRAGLPANFLYFTRHLNPLLFELEGLAMLTILVIILIIFMLGGWGYGRGRGGSYGNPMGIIGIILLVLLVVWLFNRGGI
jgi:uncharacterized membrane protein